MTEHMNPRFDPQWENVHAKHMVWFHFWRARQSEFLEGERYDDADSAGKKANLAHNRALECYTKQHRTIREYAEWLFDAFPPGIRAIGFTKGDAPYVLPDFSHLASIEETQAAWEKAASQAEAAFNDVYYGLPVGQPPGMVAFGEPETVLRFQRTIDLTSYGYGPKEVHVSIDPEQEDGAHICFTDMRDTGQSVTNIFEHLASVIFREACELTTGRKVTDSRDHGRSWSKWFKRRVDAPPLDPSRFHFYQHDPVRGHFPETFEMVRLEFDGTSFRSPRWQRLPCVPAAIRDGLSEAARTVAAGFAAVERRQQVVAGLKMVATGFVISSEVDAERMLDRKVRQARKCFIKQFGGEPTDCDPLWDEDSRKGRSE